MKRILAATLFATTTVLLTSLVAQGRPATGIPRLVDGKPDMQGYWTNHPSRRWTRPWSGEYEMSRIEGPLFEYACHEGNYQFPSILKGARRAEEVAAR
jgi:hypothetical protein